MVGKICSCFFCEEEWGEGIRNVDVGDLIGGLVGGTVLTQAETSFLVWGLNMWGFFPGG